MSSYRMTRILKITVYNMLTGFLALLKSDGVNKLGELSTVLEGLYSSQFPIKPSNTDNDKYMIVDVVYNTNRPVCLILLDNEHFELYFLTNEPDWEHTIYLVSILGQYAMINNPTTPKKLINKFEENKFEENKDESTNATEDIQAIEGQLLDLMKLDHKKDFLTIEAFKKIYQLKPSTSRKIMFANNYPSEIKQDIPKSSTISKSSNGTRSKLQGILKTRKNNGIGSVPAPTPRTSPITSPINNSPRTNKPTYMDLLFPKNRKKKTTRILGPGPAMRELIRRTHKGWEKEKINP